MKKIFITTLALASFATFAQVPTNYAWAKKAGGTGTEEGKAITADGLGNIFVGGFYKATATFGSLPAITAVANHDAFVAKYDSLGNALWVQSVGGSDIDEIYGVSSDALGNVYAVGVYGTAISAGTTTLTSAGSIDFFVAKYTAAGSLSWIKSYGSVNSEYGYAIDTDADGNSYIAGKFNTSTTLGGVSLTAVGQDDIFILKMDSTGAVSWAKRAGSTSSDFAKGIARDGAGNIYITGNFSGTATFYGITNVTLTTSGQWDAFVAKYDATGNALWARKGGGSNHDHGLAIDADVDGNAVITGYLQSTSANFNGVTLTNSGNWDVFIARFNTSGTQTWAKRYGAAQYDYAYAVNVDKNKQIYFTGGFGTTVPFGTFTLTSTNSTTEDLFITKLDTLGAVLWAMKAGAPAGEYTWGNAISSDQFGGVYATGSFEGTASFGTASLSSAGGDEAYGEDIFVCKIDQAAITTALASQAGTTGIKIYPTLTSGKVRIEAGEEILSVKVYDDGGREVSSYAPIHNETFDLQLSNRPQGIYFVQVVTSGSSSLQKLILSYQ
jgi:hypothetical protein